MWSPLVRRHLSDHLLRYIESMPTFAAAFCERDLIRHNGLVTHGSITQSNDLLPKMACKSQAGFEPGT